MACNMQHVATCNMRYTAIHHATCCNVWQHDVATCGMRTVAKPTEKARTSPSNTFHPDSMKCHGRVPYLHDAMRTHMRSTTYDMTMQALVCVRVWRLALNATGIVCCTFA